MKKGFWVSNMTAVKVLGICMLLFIGISEARRFQSTCETIPSDIHITKDEFDSNSVLIRTCEETVAVNKCEGACVSSIKPSALSSHGFQKECSCCRESSHRQRALILGSCFDPDGVKLTGDLGTMKVTLNEPIDCRCHQCGKRF